MAPPRTHLAANGRKPLGTYPQHRFDSPVDPANPAGPASRYLGLRSSLNIDPHPSRAEKTCPPGSDPAGTAPIQPASAWSSAGVGPARSWGSGRSRRGGGIVDSIRWGCFPAAVPMPQRHLSATLLRPRSDRKPDQHGRDYTFRGNPTNMIPESPGKDIEVSWAPSSASCRTGSPSWPGVCPPGLATRCGPSCAPPAPCTSTPQTPASPASSARSQHPYAA